MLYMGVRINDLIFHYFCEICKHENLFLDNGHISHLSYQDYHHQSRNVSNLGMYRQGYCLHNYAELFCLIYTGTMTLIFGFISSRHWLGSLCYLVSACQGFGLLVSNL